MVEQPFRSPTPLEALLERAVREPDRVALIAGGESWSCARLVEESARLADAFRARDLRPGDRVALHMPNLAEAILVYLACWRSGAIAVPINTRYRAPELAALIARVEPRLYLGHVSLYGAAMDAGNMPADRCFVLGPGDLWPGCRPWSALIEVATGGASRSAVESIPDDAPTLLLATSGTTGPLKLVIWTPRVLASLAAVAAPRGFGPDDVGPLNAPLMHASGVTGFSSALLTGAVLVLLQTMEAEATLDAVAEHRCTSLWMLPFAYGPLVRAQRARPRDVSSLRLCMTGGDVCPPETEQAFSDTFGLPLLSMWGATEDVHASIPAPRPGPLTRLASGVRARFVDVKGDPLPDGEEGEALIRSPGTTPGYWRDSGRIDPLPDGWFHTGDLMRREPDGLLRYLGRSKDLIVRGGSNVSPVEVEDVLRRQAGVADAAVAGLPDAELGQRVGAVLVLAGDASAETLPGLIADARRHLADYKMPERIALVEAIPRNSLTKVDRMAVAKVLADRGRAV